MNATNIAMGAALSYLAGSIPWGYILVRVMRGYDIREKGSGNIGATNVFRVEGPVLGLVTGVLDAGKGALGAHIFCAINPGAPAWLGILGGLAAVAGHNWTVWLKFRGGRGVLTTAGVFAYFAWLPLVLSVLVFGAVFAAGRMVSLGSICGALALPVFAVVVPGGWRDPVIVALSIVAAALIVARHRANIRRIIAGTEYRFGRGRGNKGR
jgi:glycerol-3-phosphate acyltransferase PlsY